MNRVVNTAKRIWRLAAVVQVDGLRSQRYGTTSRTCSPIWYEFRSAKEEELTDSRQGLTIDLGQSRPLRLGKPASNRLATVISYRCELYINVLTQVGMGGAVPAGMAPGISS
jgi:hypothetical protein